MKGFFKFIGSLVAILSAVIGALAFLDKLQNKHRIKGNYLKCDFYEYRDEEFKI